MVYSCSIISCRRITALYGKQNINKWLLPVNRQMNKSQQMRWTRRGAGLLLQVRCAVTMARSVPGLGSASSLPQPYTHNWHWQPDPQVLDSLSFYGCERFEWITLNSLSSPSHEAYCDDLLFVRRTGWPQHTQNRHISQSVRIPEIV
jgi:hypothetical protein